MNLRRRRSYDLEHAVNRNVLTLHFAAPRDGQYHHLPVHISAVIDPAWFD